VTHEELTAAGCEVSAAAYQRLARFVQALVAENRTLNLTAAGDEGEIWRVHVCDSLAVLPWLQKYRPSRLLDLGSGGGLPGVPLACVCETLEVTLLDATRKKVAALQRIIAAVGLEHVQAVWGRAEALAHDPAYRERFDAVTARAVASLPVLIEYAAGFLRLGGYVWFYKSAAAADVEGAAAESAAATCRLVYADALQYRLPGDETERVIVGYRKTGALGGDLPRGPGRAKKRPL
jgi:16S rRNA (guanine527-N7)-methyltransferase